MAYTIIIKGHDLIDWLEDKVGGVYANTDSEDAVEDIRLGYNDKITITIGK
jgi:hypothetical protein